MKKYLFPALALGLVMTSCQSDEPFAPVDGGEKQVTFTLNVPGDLGTRAGATDNASDKGGFSNSQGNLSYTLVLTANGDSQTLTKEDVVGKTVTFSPTVILGREYTVTAYAHFGDTAQENLENIAITKDFNDESKDVYFFTTSERANDPTINFATEGTEHSFTLRRPFAKLRLIAEDYNEKSTEKPITDVKNVTLTYNNDVYAVFNAVTGEFSEEAEKTATKEWNKDYYEASIEEGSKTIFADYVPVNANGDFVAPFTITVEYCNGETYRRTFAQDIPVKRNALTTLKGNFFTAGAEITVVVDDEFEGTGTNIDFVTVATATQLQEAINNGGNGETIILTDDIELTEPLIFGASSANPAPTRSGATSNFVLNLNGNDITGIDTGTASYGLITIKKGANLTIEGNGKIALSATQNRGWNAYSSVISNQQGKLTINGGTLEHQGGTDMAYAIDNLTNGKGTCAETIINGGTIKSTYRAIRQFLNGIEAQNILTVNGGTIEGTNKSIWMQDPSAKANSGTLKVYEDATINSNICIEGNTKWDVEVYIEKAALNNNSTIISENVPAGYLVEENEDYYTIVTLDDVLEANFVDNSWENIILACQLNKVPNDWKVGDKKTMTIGGAEYNIAIIGKDHDTYTEGGKAPLTFQLTEKVYGFAAMNATPTNATGWSGSQMRTVTMPEILSVMPSEVSKAIKAVDKLTLKGDGSGLETTSDKLFLMSLIEVYGSTFYSNGYEEGSKYEYYSDIEKRMMDASWWLRGPGINNNKNNGIGFTEIVKSGLMGNGDASYASGVVFGFCF